MSEKLLTKEIETQMKNMFASPDYCNCVFRGKTFDTTEGHEAISGSDQITHLATGYSTGPLDTSPCTVMPSNFVPRAGTVVPGSQTMTIGSVGMGPLSLVSPGKYKADMEVSFTNSIRPLKPIKTSLHFSIDITGGTPTNRPFMACGLDGLITTSAPVTIFAAECQDRQAIIGPVSAYKACFLTKNLHYTHGCGKGTGLCEVANNGVNWYVRAAAPNSTHPCGSVCGTHQAECTAYCIR